MYSQVPPPNDSSCEASTSIAALSHDHLQDPSERTKPDHVTTSHWKVGNEIKRSVTHNTTCITALLFFISNSSIVVQCVVYS